MNPVGRAILVLALCVAGALAGCVPTLGDGASRDGKVMLWRAGGPGQRCC